MTHINDAFIGWFNFPGFYNDMVKRIPEFGKFIEVGVYEGKSFSHFIVEAVNMQKPIDCIAVDAFPWEGLEEKFISNMRPLKNYYRYVKGDSSETSAMFNQHSIDLVFIDANHTYEFVKRDIEAWTPKIKKGGILAGHDYGNDGYRPYQGVYDAVNELFPGIVDEQYMISDDVWMIQL